jgi:hypothetical protein
MSYCQFQNTLTDLQECAENIQATDLSREEKRARKRLIEVCRDIVADAERETQDEEE